MKTPALAGLPWTYAQGRVSGQPLPYKTPRGQTPRVPSTHVATVISNEFGSYAHYPPKHATAHGKLIAAAPELLASVTMVLDAGDDREAIDYDMLRVALKKAGCK